MAQFVELDMDQGSDFSFYLTLSEDDGTPKDLTGYSFECSFAKSAYSLNPLSLNTEIESAVEGVVLLSLSASDTRCVTPGRYVFDIKQIDSSNSISKIIEGILTVNPQVTK